MPERRRSLLARLFPRRADNRFDGHRAAPWLLGLFVALKLVVGLNSILDTEAVAAGADGIPLAGFGAAAAREVLLLFALAALGQLALAAVALAVLVRWRALVPFVYLVALGEQLARRLLVAAHDVARAGGSPVGWGVTWGVLAVLALGLALSLIPAGGRRRPAPRAGRSSSMEKTGAPHAALTASQMLSTTSSTIVSSSPSAITLISGSVPDLRMTSRPTPFSRCSPAAMADLTPSDSSGAPPPKRTFFRSCGSGSNWWSISLAGRPSSTRQASTCSPATSPSPVVE